ncbi:hypothetical protein WICPIJ_004012 [Wickerhamomyces pijperi]|uniref:Uncharacterized protein n=1 Tax=Wickerhamomyces pijperi TaxID=599730 RepID=A0A9P8Q8T8_WICPI|nr:hypothetical protein WICPIJ_004012 [Wickerhamomyces pijperi]
MFVISLTVSKDTNLAVRRDFFALSLSDSVIRSLSELLELISDLFCSSLILAWLDPSESPNSSNLSTSILSLVTISSNWSNLKYLSMRNGTIGNSLTRSLVGNLNSFLSVEESNLSSDGEKSIFFNVILSR